MALIPTSLNSTGHFRSVAPRQPAHPLKDMEACIEPGTIAVCPTGALGTTVHYYLSSQLQRPGVFFIDRPGSERHLTHDIRIRIPEPGSELGYRSSTVPLDRFFRPGGLVELAQRKQLPEVLMVMCNAGEQLSQLLAELVALLAWLHQQSPPLCCEQVARSFPIVLFTSNGMYYHALLTEFTALLTDASAMGRIPSVLETGGEGCTLGGVLRKVVRAPSLANGIRIGSGDEAEYLIGASKMTSLVGGGAVARQRAYELMAQGELPCILMPEGTNVMTVELRKAHVNLCIGLVGIMLSVSADGQFVPATVGDCMGSAAEADLLGLTDAVIQVANASHNEDFAGLTPDVVLGELSEKLAFAASLVSSSVQLVREQLHRKTLEIKMTPTEEALLQPLRHFAFIAGLSDIVDFLNDIEHRFLACIRRLCDAAGLSAPKRGSLSVHAYSMTEEALKSTIQHQARVIEKLSAMLAERGVEVTLRGSVVTTK